MPELKKYKMFIGGQWIDSDTKKTFETLNPEDNKPWAVVPEASASDVDKAVQAAQKAFEGDWPKILPRERAKFLRAIGNKLRDNAELLGKIETIEKKSNIKIIFLDFTSDNQTTQFCLAVWGICYVNCIRNAY